MKSAFGYISGLLVMLTVTLMGGPTCAQENLDKNKSGAELFKTTCAVCHRSARGLAKGKYKWILSSFLQQHYTTNAATARTLTEYLKLVDIPRAKSKSRDEPSRLKQVPRPPAPVPIGKFIAQVLPVLSRDLLDRIGLGHGEVG